MRFFSLLVASVVLATSTQAHDIVLRDQGKAILGVSYPSDWKHGQGVVDRAQTTIQFSSNGKVAGDTSVNRYQGQANIDGANIDVGPLATTRRAGPPALMDQETKFLKAIETVKSFRIEPTGLLFLLNESGDAVLRLSPMDATNRE